MIDLILSFLPGEWIAAAGLAIVALVATWFGGRKAGKTDAKVDALKSEVKAHERINEADLGSGASDIERIRRLREFAERHGG
jgi:hypothetical protein